MQRIDVSVFKGMAPRVSPALLENGQGVHVVGEATSGELRPWRVPALVETCPPGTLGIFLTRQGHWLTFDERIHGVHAPQAEDAFGRTYYTRESGGLYVVSPLDDYEEFLAGVPIPAAAPTVAITGEGEGTVQDRTYRYTYVNDWGEESAPGPASAFQEYVPGQTVTLTGFSVPDLGYKLIVSIRIYRMGVGATGADWLFVNEIAAAATEFVDAVPEAALGEVLATEDYDLPQSGARGLVALGSGVLASFEGNEVAFCEPYHPYAWPDKYRISVPNGIVALGVAAAGMVVLTSGAPEWIGTTHASASRLRPDEYSQYSMGEVTPCLSPHGVVSTEFGAVFPAQDGLRVIRDGTPSKLLTTELLTRKEWMALFDPISLVAAYYDGRYFGFTSQGGFAYDLRTNVLTWTGLSAAATHTDALGLFVVNGGAILEWEGSEGLMRAVFQSRVFRFEKPLNFSHIRADTALGEFWGRLAAYWQEIYGQNLLLDNDPLSLVDEVILGQSVAGNDLLDLPFTGGSGLSVPLRIWADGVLRYDGFLPLSGQMRLPAGFVAREWQFRISSPAQIKQVTLGTSVRATISRAEGG